MKILVCGGRKYNKQDVVDKILNQLNPTSIVHGYAPGADRLAAYWAHCNDVAQYAYPAERGEHGKSAGPRRNQSMLDYHPDIEMGVAFPGGKETEDMIKRMLKKNIPVCVVLGDCLCGVVP